MTQTPDRVAVWLLIATFVVAVAGLIYELIAGTVASYLLGDSVTQFSLVIGFFMTAMGLGAWVSRFVPAAESGFAWSQTGLGLIGGFSAPILFLAFAYLNQVSAILFTVVIAIGALAGLEIPLITRILNDRQALSHVLSSVLTADYAGALVAALLFPLVIIPQLGLMSASLAFGILNMLVAGLTLWIFRDRISWLLRSVWLGGLLALVAGLIWSDRIVSLADAALFEDDVIVSEETAYQRIVLTRFGERYRLFLNGAIQFDSLDEHRYHESLVHPAMALAPSRAHVLVLGGGDGMAVREVLKWESLESVTLVDLDPRMTELFRDRPQLAELNDSSLSDPRVRILNEDAWTFSMESREAYDVVILDFPDPRTPAISKLYTREFYALLVERLRPTSIVVTQAGSPVFARRAFWSVTATLGAARNPFASGKTLNTLPYHAYVPSFGDWGFVIATPGPLPMMRNNLPDGLRFMTPDMWPAMQVFAPDSAKITVSPNSIQNHELMRHYREGWAKWYE
ncbi:MAG: polyamine aminopropyltransferase [Gammaproteobacteria bacterium]